MSDSKLILGTVQMGLNYGVNNSTGKISLQDSLRILECAYENGIRTLDTAEAYGNAHKVIGEFHKLHPNYKFGIITEIPKQVDGALQGRINGYLEQLQVESIDTLMFHAYSTYVTMPKVLAEINVLKEKGVVKNSGISIYTNQEFSEVLCNRDFDVIQIPFNLLDNQTVKGSLIELAKAKQKKIHTRSAFLQGLFFKDPAHHPVAKAIEHELNLVKHLAEKENMSVAALALNYCLQSENIDNVLIGVDNIEQLNDNLSLTNQTISMQSINEINEIKIDNLNLLNPSLWQA